MDVQEPFWQRSSWLSRGALLCLRTRQADGSTRMDLAEVAARDARTLAAQCRAGSRATIGLRFCHTASILHGLCHVASSCHGGGLLTAESDADKRGPVEAALLRASCATMMDAVQLAHDFAVYKPVLQALQEERLLTPPFGDILFSEAKPPVSGFVAPPVWENDESAAAWLQRRVETMDDAQRAAFDHALGRRVALIQGPPGIQRCHVQPSNGAARCRHCREAARVDHPNCSRSFLLFTKHVATPATVWLRVCRGDRAQVHKAV